MFLELCSRLKVRIYAIVALSIGLLVLLASVILSLAVDNAYRLREQHLSDVVDAGYSLLAELDRQVSAGDITRPEAMAQAQEFLTVMSFDGTGYYFVVDNDYLMQVHPLHPEWIGTDQSGYVDHNGFAVFKQARDLGVEAGQAAYHYEFENPATGVEEGKITFVRHFAPWNWNIAAGSYVSDIREGVSVLRRLSLGLAAAGLLILAGLSTLLIRSITGPITALIARMGAMTQGEIRTPIPHVNARGEMGEMARAIEVFRGGLEERQRLEREQADKEEEIRQERAAAAEREQAMEAQRLQEERAREEERLRQEAEATRQLAEAERVRNNSDQAQIVKALAHGLGAISSGDLTVRLDQAFPEAYETLRVDFNQAVERISALVGSILSGADTITRETGALNSAADELSRRTESQAASLEQTAAAVTELTASVENSSQGAVQAAQTVSEARERTASGSEVVQRTVVAMEAIAESSSKISRITSVIDDIAFQTNLLALNAGVEAARAGESGRGFAVVASEVRALALRSSEAAREIAKLIETSGQQVDTGVGLVNSSGEALAEIEDLVSTLDQSVRAISETSQQQATGLSEISLSVTQLDQVTQQNSAMFEETAATVASLQHQAQRLQSDGGAFALDRSAPAARATAA